MYIQSDRTTLVNARPQVIWEAFDMIVHPLGVGDLRKFLSSGNDSLTTELERPIACGGNAFRVNWPFNGFKVFLL